MSRISLWPPLPPTCPSSTSVTKFALRFHAPRLPFLPLPYHDPTSIDCSTALLPYFYGFTPPTLGRPPPVPFRSPSSCRRHVLRVSSTCVQRRTRVILPPCINVSMRKGGGTRAGNARHREQKLNAQSNHQLNAQDCILTFSPGVALSDKRPTLRVRVIPFLREDPRRKVTVSFYFRVAPSRKIVASYVYALQRVEIYFAVPSRPSFVSRVSRAETPRFPRPRLLFVVITSVPVGKIVYVVSERLADEKNVLDESETC
ncbi:hypothetical protein PUN28_015558 [Cardiocondyla obscurior]|uniref:Uncharacterized protein n=1 Tax=Cardiocondyla obscurior TaxID=286306 RepID=A0AAW2EW81_9HYME